MRRAVVARLPFLILTLIAIAFRLPAIANAGATTADGTVVGLQAMHLLHGEASWYLWGTTYQGGIEPLLLAPLIAIFGPTVMVLLVFCLIGHVIVMWLAFAIVRRHLGVARAFVLTLTLAITTWPAMSPSIVPPRMYAIVFYFIGLYLLDSAATSKRPFLRYAVGAAFPMLAVFSDVYTSQMVPAAIFFAMLTTLDGTRSRALSLLRMTAAFSGVFVMGAILYWLRAKTGDAPTKIGAENFPKNFPHLWDEALPALVGLKYYEWTTHLGDNGWHLPRWFVRVQMLGALSIFVTYAVANLSFAWTRIPWPCRRLGLFALVTALASIGGFLSYFNIRDVQAMRYLAPMTWTLPFALAPLASYLRARTLPFFLAPYLASTMVAGWFSYGQWVAGPNIVASARGRAEDERWLGEALRLRGIHYAAGQYWLSYRLTYLWREDPTVVPISDGDRYGPYRQKFDAAEHVAYIFHPSAPLSKAADYEKQLEAAKTPFTEETIAGFTVLTFDRPPK